MTTTTRVAFFSVSRFALLMAFFYQRGRGSRLRKESRASADDG